MSMNLLIVIIPLLSAITSGLLGRYIGEKGSTILTTSLISITSILSWISLYNYLKNPLPTYIHLWNWIESGSLQINLGLQFDGITIIMLTLVTSVSALVHIYSSEYMAGDPHVPRFMSYLSLFTFFMIILVTADNFLQLFIGWEGVGLCSYLLINFWFTRIQANKSAIKAMIVNRVGDIGVTLAIFTIFILFGSLDFSTVFALVHKLQNHYIIFFNFNIHTLTLISILLLIGAIGKSAQLGLHTWLPDAMEGWSRIWQLGLSLNSTICGNILDDQSSLIKLSSEKSGNCIGQSAGNLQKGASETICGTLDKYSDQKYVLNKSADKNFIEWFRGFTEGDGSFIINRNGYLEFKITQSSNDAQILFYIKKNLGFGSVSKQCKSNNTHHFRVRDKNNLLRIINIFNGKLYTRSRHKQFSNFVLNYNKKYQTNIPLLPSKIHFTSKNLKTSWLAGFTDAEGCFTVSLIKRTDTYTQVQVRFILSQKQEKDFFEELSVIIKGKTHYLKSYNGYNLTVNLTKLKLLIKYFAFHPLKTKKKIDYLNWLKIYDLVINQKHRIPDQLEKIKKIKQRLNQPLAKKSCSK